MPIIQLYGAWTKKLMTSSLPLQDEVKRAVTGIEELELTEAQISCQFITPYIHNEREVIVFVVGLFDRPTRTEAVRQRLAEAVRDTVAKRFPECFVEVFVNPFPPSNGFATTST